MTLCAIKKCILLREIGRVVDVARLYKAIGNAWLAYANSPEGKAHLEESGHSIADIMREAGFTFSNQIAQARATADQRTEVLQASNWQPAIEEELDALLEDIEAEEQLAEINQQEANQPTTIPAEESITGQEITIEPEQPLPNLAESIIKLARAKANLKEVEANITRSIESAEKARKEYKKHLNAYKRLAKKYKDKTWKNKQEADYRQSELEASKEYAESFLHDAERAESDIVFWQEQAEKYRQEIETLTPNVSSDSSEPTSEQETLVSPDETPEFHLLSLIASGKAKTQDFARFFRDNPGLTEAQATELGIRPLTQRGTPTATYTQGRLIAANLTPQQFEDYLNGKLKGKALKQALSEHGTLVPTTSNFSIKAGQQEMQNVHNCVQELSSGEDGTLRNTAWGHDIIVPHGRIGKKGYGVNHMHEKRLLHGFTEDEAAFIIVCAMKAAATVRTPIHKGSSLWFERFGIRAAVAEKGEVPRRLLTGFILDTQGGNEAVDSKAAELAQSFYALDELSRVQVVGAALQKAVTQFEQIVNNNPENWEQIITAIVKELQIKQNTKAEGGVYEGSPLDAFSATAAESADLFTDGALEAENAIVTKPGANFSIKPAAADALDRFTVDPLGERIIHHIRTEARRYARLLGDNAPYEQAVNAAQSAASIIGAVDKYLHTPGKPVPARYRRQLQKLRSIAEKYAQIIASGTPRSFKKISPQEKQELEAAIAELEAQELDTATTESDQLLPDSDCLTKREAAARAREHHRAIVRSAAKGRVYQTLSSMLEVTADALDSYLKHQLLTKLDRLTATVKIKRSPSKRLQGKMTAPAYRELERAINLMALSDRAYQDEIENVITAHETLARAINQGNTNLTSGNALLIQLADQLTTSGQQVTPQALTAALANHEAALKIYGNVSSKNYEQTRLMAM